jgi:hypothetical protein
VGAVVYADCVGVRVARYVQPIEEGSRCSSGSERE